MATKPAAKVTIDEKAWNNIKKVFAESHKNSYTTVGIHEDAGSADNGMSLARIAAIQEYGVHITVTDKMRGYLGHLGLHLKKSTVEIIIPERSFLRAWVDEHKEELQQYIDTLVGHIIDGKITVEKALASMGEKAVSGVKLKIVQGISPANHPFTIERKGGKSKPLINIGRLIGAITHKEHIE